MRIFLKVAAFIFAVIFVLLLPIAHFTSNLQKDLMNPEPYKAVLAQQGFYQKIPELIATQLTELNATSAQDSTEGPSELFGFLDDEELTLILEEVIPDQWSQTQVENGLDSLFEFFNGDAEQFTLTLSLTEVKTTLNGPKSEQVIDLLFASLPPCTGEEIEAALLNLLLTGELNLPLCAPPEEILTIGDEIFQALLPTLVEGIPEKLSVRLAIEDFNVADPNRPGETTNLVENYRALRGGLQYLPHIMGLLLVLIALFSGPPWRRIPLWWGLSVSLGSTITLLLARFASARISTELLHFLFARIPERFLVQFRDIITDGVRQIVVDVLNSMVIQAAILLAIGIGLMLVGYLLQPLPRAKEPDQVE